MPAAFGLADLALVAAAIFCFLAANSITYVTKAIGNQLPNFSILGVGIDIGRWFIDLGEDAANWLTDRSKNLWHEAEVLFRAFAFIFDRLFDATISAISHAFDYLDHIATTQIPNAVGGLRRDVEDYTDRAVKGVEADIGTAVGKLAGVVAGDVRKLEGTISSDVSTLGDTIVRSVAAGVVKAEDFASHEINGLRNYVDSAIAAAVAGLEHELADAKQQIGTAIAGVAQTAATDLANAEGVLSNQITSVATTAATEISTAEQAVAGEITDLAGTVANEIGSAVGTLTGDIASEAQAFTGDLTSLRALLEAAIASSVGALAVRVAKLEECAVGVCNDSPNNFSNLLNAALGGVSIALLAEFLKTAIQHPAEAEAGFVGEVGDLFTGGRDLFDSLLNL